MVAFSKYSKITVKLYHAHHPFQFFPVLSICFTVRLSTEDTNLTVFAGMRASSTTHILELNITQGRLLIEVNRDQVPQKMLLLRYLVPSTLCSLLRSTFWVCQRRWISRSLWIWWKGCWLWMVLTGLLPSMWHIWARAHFEVCSSLFHPVFQHW